jgi:putative phosphoesterase
MKIGVLSDIHGNHLALKAVLDDAEQINVEQLLILGDMVGYYYHPDKVLKMLSSWPVKFIQGNHERLLQRFQECENEKKKIEKKYGSGIRYAHEKLNSEQVKHLVELPESRVIQIDELKIQMLHGSPWNKDFYIYPDKITKVLHKFEGFNSDFIFLGHTHYPFVFSRRNQVIANVGSVGQARDRGGLASWVCLDTSNRSLVFKHTPYETSSIIDEVKRIDPDVPYLHQILERGRQV